MKRIVLLVTTEGSAITFYKGYLRYLQQKEWDVVIVAKSNGAIEKWAAHEGATARSIDFKRNPSLFHDLKALWSTYVLLRKLKPEVVISATPKAGLLGTLAGKLSRVPVRIYQLWGLRLETEKGLKRRLLAAFERIAIGASTQCVANSNSLARTTENLGLAPVNSISVLGKGSSHGVDLAHFSSDMVPSIDTETEAFLEPKTALTVAFVGRLIPDKGVETLLDAISIVHKQGIAIAALLVGAIENEEIAEQIDQAPDYVYTTGKVKDVRPYILAADVLCLPTLREGFPNVVLEAAALNVPAIVTDATGSLDSVVNGETGWVFPMNDADALASILTDISEHRDLICRYGVNARKRVETEFEQSRMWFLQVQNIEEQLKLYASNRDLER